MGGVVDGRSTVDDDERLVDLSDDRDQWDPLLPEATRDDTDAGWGRTVSGLLDAGFVVASDPLNVAGALTKGARFGRWAFTLEDADDIGRGFRVTDAAIQAMHARAGTRAPALLHRLDELELQRGSRRGWRP